jgi:hypothetical protein
METPQEIARANQQLKQRVLAAFPAGQYALDTLFRLADIVSTTEVETAAIECLAEPRLLMNPEFVEKNCQTDEHLFMLVMHELHHVLLGHTRLFQRQTPLDNLVFDAVINAVLSQLFCDSTYFTFFQKLYRADQFPECLLRPPDGWPKQWILPTNLPAPVREMIRVLYSQASGTYKEVYDLFTNDANLKKAFGNMPLLLGDHSPENTTGRGEQAANHPSLKKAVRSIVEKWPQPPTPIRGRSVGNQIREIVLEGCERPTAADALLGRLLKDLVEGKTGARVSRHMTLADRNIEAPLPTIRDRRAFVNRALGWTPLIYKAVVPQRRVDWHRGQTTVYVDVSGSTRAYWSLMASLVRPYVEKGLVRLFVFSEVVDEVTPVSLAAGRFKTTGGTDATCIWKHAIDTEFRKILILTDGYVGQPSRHWADKLTQARLTIKVALTPNGFLEDLEHVADEITELPLWRER